MANIKHFADLNGETIQLGAGYIESLPNKEFAAMFPGVKGKRYDSFAMQVKRHNGIILPVTRAIEFKRNPSLHKCDARCTHAKGHKCECSCGGANHGRGH